MLAYVELIHFDLFLARKSFAALYKKGQRLSNSPTYGVPQRYGENLRRSKYRLHLVLERSAVPSAIGRNDMFAEELWRPCANDNRCSAVAILGPRMGGG